MSIHLKAWLSLAVATSALAWSGQGGAQTIADATASGPDGKIEEVIVTAEKRSELAHDLPASISVLSREALDQRGLDTTESLQFETPSLQYGEFGSVQVASIRGVGTNQYGAAVQPGVAIYIDGVYQARTMTGNLAQVDLDRVEVLRGPAGTLYGRNAVGGAINFITQQPTDQLGGYLQAGYASYDEYRVQGVANVPLSDSVRTRLMLDYDDRQDGWIKNVVPGQPNLGADRDFSGRFQLAADLASNVTFNLSAYAVDAGGNNIYLEWYGPPPNFAPAHPIVPLAPRQTSANDPSDSHRHMEGLTGTLDWDMGWASLKAISAYYTVSIRNALDSDGVNLSIAPSHNSIASTTFSQEFDLSGKDFGLDWVTGLYYLDDTLHYASEFDFNVTSGTIPAGVGLITGQSPYTTKSYAGFADGTYNVTDAFRLIAGMRYSRDDVNLLQTNLTTYHAAPLAIPGTCNPPVAFQRSFDSFTPRGGAQYDFNDNENLYFTVSRGFKAGGFNSGSCGNSFKPERLTSYEVGLKSRLFDNHLILDGAAFYYDYTDLQLQQYLSNASTIVNVPQASVRGLELQATAAPDVHWELEGNLSLLDATYDTYSNVDVLNPAAGIQNLAGNSLDRSPKMSGNVGIQYTTSPFDGIGVFTARADAYATSRVYYREFENPQDSQAPYGLLNVSLVWESPDQKMTGRLYGTNLTNTDYITSLSSTNQYNGRFVTWGPPSQVGIEFRVHY